METVTPSFRLATSDCHPSHPKMKSTHKCFNLVGTYLCVILLGSMVDTYIGSMYLTVCGSVSCLGKLGRQSVVSCHWVRVTSFPAFSVLLQYSSLVRGDNTSD